MAAKTNWSDIVPNFDSMPDGMQQWLMTNLPTFISQAIQEGLQQGFDQHWGVAATGNSYHLVGTDHTHAVMGDHNEVVGGQTTRTRQDSVMTHNLADEIKVTEGAHSHQVNSDTFYLTLGTENRTIASHHATEVGGDHTLVVGGNSAAVAATHTVITGSGNTDDSVVTHSHTVTGSRYEAVSGTHYIQSGVVIRSVGGPLSTNFTPPTLPPPAPKSNPNGVSDGAMAHPSLAQALGVSTQPAPTPTPTLTAAAVAKPLTQHATKETLSAQQKQQAAGQPQTSAQQLATQSSSTEQQQLTGSTDDTKTDLKIANMTWQTASVGATGIVTAGLALSAPADDPLPLVESTDYQGSIQDNIDGDRTTIVLGKMSDSFLDGADTFTKGSASDTVLGMAGDTVIGLSSDALIGLAMPFTLISMGQVLLNMDEDVCVVHSKSFMLDIAGMKITTPGGDTWGGTAAAEATDLEKAEKLLADAKTAENAAKKAQETVDAAKAAKDAKALKDEEAIQKTAALEKQAHRTAELEEAAAATRTMQKEAEEAEKAERATIFSRDSVAGGDSAELATVAEKFEKDAEESKALETTLKAAKEEADKAKTVTDKTFAEHFPNAAADAEKAKEAAEAAKAVDPLAQSSMSKFFKAGQDFFKAGSNITKDSKALGSIAKTLIKGFDYASAFKALGYDADKALAMVKVIKAAYISSMKIAGADNRIKVARNQSAAVRENADTDRVTKLEPPKSKT